MQSHEIDYQVHGDDMQFVEITLDPQEAVIAEAGAMMYMDADVGMETKMGDGSNPKPGLFDTLMSVGKRVVTGESLFMTRFTALGSKRSTVAFGAPYPGTIVPLDLHALGGQVLCQKQSFLCAALGTKVSIGFNKRIGVGLFGGEGFIMQKLEGDGLAFAHAGGTVIKRTLGPGQVLKVDTGCIVALQNTIDYDIERVRGVRSMLFGGEGLFFATVTGPGDVWLQSLPFSRLADRIIAAVPRTGGKSTGEGSVLGGLGRLLDGDN